MAQAKLSVVLPVHNEEASLLALYDRLTFVMTGLRENYELIFVDDASTDGSFQLLANLAQTDPHLSVVRLRRNFGQTAALSAGFHRARGEVIIAMDSDLQNQPEDIPLLLSKMAEGYDVVSGWRKDRHDNAVTRLLPSRIANWLIAKIFEVPLHDFGATLKAYRAEILRDVHLYGQMHRFIPVLASFYGARIAEVAIRHTARAHGRSHYGIGRTISVILDLITLKFLLGYLTRPMHLFGKWGLVSTTLGALILGVLLLMKIAGESLMQHGPLMGAGGLLLLAGLMMFSTGLVGELLIRTYFEGSERRTYAIREVRSYEDTSMQPKRE